MSDRTTVEISKANRDALKESRLPHESSYDETIERLLGRNTNPYPTKEEVKKIAREVANEQIGERVVTEAQL